MRKAVKPLPFYFANKATSIKVGVSLLLNKIPMDCDIFPINVNPVNQCGYQ